VSSMNIFDYLKPSTWQQLLNIEITTNLFISLLDILVVWYVIYKLIMLLNGTKAIQVFKGIAVIIFVRIVSDLIGLNTVSWLMNQVITYGAIATIVIFQPEVRRGLEQLGRGAPFKSRRRQEESASSFLIDELDKAIQYMSKRKIGALICIEKNTPLNEYVETGISLDADVSSELLINIFIPNTPLHDGAVIIQNNRISSSNSYLPLSEDPSISKEFGTRHRAAIGLSEVTDALTIVVSEETGDVSLTLNDRFYPRLSQDEYIAVLEKELEKLPKNSKNVSVMQQFFDDIVKGVKRDEKK